MNTQSDNNNEVARELAKRLADMENANTALKEEIERKHKALEGFIAENEALKAELAGKGSHAPVTAKDGNTAGGLQGSGSKGLDDLVAQARRLGW